jgi:MFS family permease
LFGSILLYSLANIGNGFVQTITQYAVLRFLAGVGLAGELGAGITLVSESMSARDRGLGTTIVAAVGICGGIAAGLVGDLFGWRTSYFIGGGLGVSLLLMRASAYESGMFEKTRKSASFRGNFLKLLTDRSRLRRYIAVILVAVPIWYVVGILVTLAPEMGRAMGMDPLPNPARAIMFCYTGIAVGDVVSGLLSQYLRSRKRALCVFLVFLVLSTAAYFMWARTSLTAFYVTVTALGLAAGYWAVFVTSAAEQFGTNLRATATTTAPNFVRGSLVPVSLLYGALKDKVGATESAIATGVVVLALAFVSLAMLEETYGRELDFTEE